MKIDVTRETIMAIRPPLDIDALAALRRAAEKNKPPGTTLFIVQPENGWFLIEAKSHKPHRERHDG